MKPRIAIPTAHSDPAYARKVMPQYRHAVESAGGIVIEVPIGITPSETAQIIRTCDGVLLPGSPADVEPQKYGEAARHPATSPMDVPRDDADELLLQDAHNMRKPILGICYGLQSLNVWRGGTLLQHIESRVRHSRQQDSPTNLWIAHPVVVEAGTTLAHIIAPCIHQDHGSPKVTVNSSHHQAVLNPGDGLRVSAVCPDDGTIEALETTWDDHFCIGVQWHPERSFEEDEPSKEIFRSLVEAARQWHERQKAKADDFETV